MSEQGKDAERLAPRPQASLDVWAGDAVGNPWPRVESTAYMYPESGGGTVNALALALFQLRAEVAELRAAIAHTDQGAR